MKYEILLIEGDEVLRNELGSALEEVGFKVTHAASGSEGLSKLYENHPELVIMSENLSGVNGEELCSRVRGVSYMPIIVLGSEEEVAGEMLEMGADAYITKPPNFAELVAKIRSLLRRRGGPNHDLPGGNPGHDPKRGTANQEDSSINFTRMESRLLSCLMLNGGRVVTHPQLIAEVWGGKKVSVDSLKFYIRRLRQKLGSDLILNHWGIGYRLAGELRK